MSGKAAGETLQRMRELEDRAQEAESRVAELKKERIRLMGMIARNAAWINGLREWVGRESDACTENVRGSRGDPFHRGAESMIRRVLTRAHEPTRAALTPTPPEEK